MRNFRRQQPSFNLSSYKNTTVNNVTMQSNTANINTFGIGNYVSNSSNQTALNLNNITTY